MSEQTSLSSFFKKSTVVKNEENKMTETYSNEHEIDERPTKKVKTSLQI